MADDSTKCEKSGIVIHEVEITAARTDCCEADYENCFKSDPFFDKTTESSVCVPLVNSTFQVQVCNPNLYQIGQWIRIYGLGRFKLVSKSGSNLLVLRNSHDDESAIQNNAEPGTCVNGVNKLWIIDEPDRLAVDVQDEIDEYLSEAEELCIPNQTESNPETDKVHLWGLFEFCSRFLKVFGINNTLCFPDIPTVDYLNPLNGTTDRRIIVQSDSECPDEDIKNCLKVESNPTEDGIESFCDGARNFLEVPADYEDVQYALQPDPDTGCPAWVELDLATCQPLSLSGGDPHLVVVKSNVSASDNGTVDVTTLIDNPENYELCWVIVLVGMKMSAPAFRVTLTGADGFSQLTIQDSVWHGEAITYTVAVPLINGETFNWANEALNSSGDAFTLRVMQVFGKLIA